MIPQEEFWAGEFGNAYTARNRVDWRARIPFWTDIMRFTEARSVYEVGCNAGWNLSAIAEISKAMLHGCDINPRAAEQARAAGLVGVSTGRLDEPPGRYDLVFTAGVLIHVAPENLPAFMGEIVDASSRWIVAIEYASDVEQMIEYRGYENRLWKRPYGKLYEALGLTILHTGEANGFDRCTYWLMEKP